jgi:hypothetical protein
MRVFRRESFEESTRVGLPCDDDGSIRPSFEKARGSIEPQAALLFQGPVAGLTTLRQHRLDLVQVVDRSTLGEETAPRP